VRPDIRAQLTGSFDNADRRFTVMHHKRADLGGIMMRLPACPNLAPCSPRHLYDLRPRRRNSATQLPYANEKGLATPGAVHIRLLGFHFKKLLDAVMDTVWRLY
jgi:hypothetical protein